MRLDSLTGAADELEDFLRQHPDWPKAAEIRRAIAKFRSQSNQSSR